MLEFIQKIVDITNMNIEHLSVSRSNTFKECAAKYKYRYHLKLKPDIIEAPYFLYGKSFHKIAEEFIKHKGQKNINEIKNDVLDGKILLEEKQTESPRKVLPKEYLNKLPDHLVSFMRLNQRIGYDGELEFPFHYDLDPPNGKFLKGFIDRIIHKNDEIFIIDYKTSKEDPRWNKNPQNIKYDLQLQCYAMVASEHFNVPAHKIKPALYYLDVKEPNNLVGACFSQATLDKTKKLMISIYDKIYNMTEKEAYGRVGQHCDRCEFRKVCQYYNLT